MTMSETAKRLIIDIMCQFLIALICGLLLNAFIKFDTQKAFISGLSLGAAVSAGKVFLMERSISKSLSMQSVSAGLYAVLQITLRNALSAGLLICAALIDTISIWGVLAGLVLLQSAAFSTRWKGV